MCDPWVERTATGSHETTSDASVKLPDRSASQSYVAPSHSTALATLAHLAGDAVYHPKGAILIEAGDRVDGVLIVERGWLTGSRFLADGRRSVPCLFLPGDVVGIADLALSHAPLTIQSVEAGAVRRIPWHRLIEGLRTLPHLREALLHLTGTEQHRAMHLLRAVSRMIALERLAYLLCDLQTRLSAIDPGQGSELHLPLQHADVADHLGLTPVYVSRTLTTLMRRGIVSKTRKGLLIRDAAALSALAKGEPSERSDGRGAASVNGRSVGSVVRDGPGAIG